MRSFTARVAALAAVAAAPVAVQAAGFATHDLTPFAAKISAAIHEDCQIAADPARVTLMCNQPGDGPLIDIFLKRRESDDHLEASIRAGKTGQAEVETLCKKLNPDCTVSMLDVPPAVGWIGAQPMRRQAVSTATLVRDGDQLTVRALASDPAKARAYVDTALAVMRPVIGQ